MSSSLHSSHEFRQRRKLDWTLVEAVDLQALSQFDDKLVDVSSEEVQTLTKAGKMLQRAQLDIEEFERHENRFRLFTALRVLQLFSEYSSQQAENATRNTDEDTIQSKDRGESERLKAALSNAEADIQVALETIEQHERELLELREMHTGAASKEADESGRLSTEKLLAQLDAEQATTRRLEVEKQNFEASIEMQNQQIETLSAELTEERQTKSRTESQLYTAQQKLHELQTRLGAERQRQDRREAGDRETSQRQALLKKELERMRGENEVLSESAVKLQTQAELYRHEILQSNEVVLQMESQLRELRSNYTAQVNASHTFESERAKLQARTEEMEAENKEKTALVEALAARFKLQLAEWNEERSRYEMKLRLTSATRADRKNETVDRIEKDKLFEPQSASRLSTGTSRPHHGGNSFMDVCDAYQQLEVESAQEIDRALGKQQGIIKQLQEQVAHLNERLNSEKQRYLQLDQVLGETQAELVDSTARNEQLATGEYGLEQAMRDLKTLKVKLVLTETQSRTQVRKYNELLEQYQELAESRSLYHSTKSQSNKTVLSKASQLEGTKASQGDHTEALACNGLAQEERSMDIQAVFSNKVSVPASAVTYLENQLFDVKAQLSKQESVARAAEQELALVRLELERAIAGNNHPAADQLKHTQLNASKISIQPQNREHTRGMNQIEDTRLAIPQNLHKVFAKEKDYKNEVDKTHHLRVQLIQSMQKQIAAETKIKDCFAKGADMFSSVEKLADQLAFALREYVQSRQRSSADTSRLQARELSLENQNSLMCKELQHAHAALSALKTSANADTEKLLISLQQESCVLSAREATLSQALTRLTTNDGRLTAEKLELENNLRQLSVVARSKFCSLRSSHFTVLSRLQELETKLASTTPYILCENHDQNMHVLQAKINNILVDNSSEDKGSYKTTKSGKMGLTDDINLKYNSAKDTIERLVGLLETTVDRLYGITSFSQETQHTEDHTQNPSDSQPALVGSDLSTVQRQLKLTQAKLKFAETLNLNLQEQQLLLQNKLTETCTKLEEAKNASKASQAFTTTIPLNEHNALVTELKLHLKECRQELEDIRHHTSSPTQIHSTHNRGISTLLAHGPKAEMHTESIIKESISNSEQENTFLHKLAFSELENQRLTEESSALFQEASIARRHASLILSTANDSYARATAVNQVLQKEFWSRMFLQIQTSMPQTEILIKAHLEYLLSVQEDLLSAAGSQDMIISGALRQALHVPEVQSHLHPEKLTEENTRLSREIFQQQLVISRLQQQLLAKQKHAEFHESLHRVMDRFSNELKNEAATERVYLEERNLELSRCLYDIELKLKKEFRQQVCSKRLIWPVQIKISTLESKAENDLDDSRFNKADTFSNKLLEHIEHIQQLKLTNQELQEKLEAAQKRAQTAEFKLAQANLQCDSYKDKSIGTSPGDELAHSSDALSHHVSSVAHATISRLQALLLEKDVSITHLQENLQRKCTDMHREKLNSDEKFQALQTELSALKVEKYRILHGSMDSNLGRTDGLLNEKDSLPTTKLGEGVNILQQRLKEKEENLGLTETQLEQLKLKCNQLETKLLEVQLTKQGEIEALRADLLAEHNRSSNRVTADVICRLEKQLKIKDTKIIHLKQAVKDMQMKITEILHNNTTSKISENVPKGSNKHRS
mmetsp:Transcript_8259/g.28980  ORF Transcript_8259/g.28980 Transcript_8259/m.28980 type:complete len:1662 (-) Transcript_8259:2968-7953(-)|eukprot:CAMPEP_0183819622 /NCGR_PEP_ID=MMETSP0803_2-20130417/64230_1 /TAXON_ID=195967 /ORGANISM="Crustomastix stigmata, Strain CCMP3273" /LENGTH=1661 /DNA_ID=CAMNT_0026064511 /DNA_START=23 /DNA_END=5008 /DNA_ORIENTATION=+